MFKVNNKDTKTTSGGAAAEAATRGVLSKSYSKKCCNIHRKSRVLESLFNKVADFLIKRTILLKKDPNTGVFLRILRNF